LIERFAGYGFNKSHSTRYAFIAYQTAYMKTYWPVEFMAALLTYEMGNTDKVVDYITECKSMGVEVQPPDINESMVDFTPLYKGHGKDKKAVVRFGLAAVKGVGGKAVEKIIEKREQLGEFQSLFHFCENVDLRAVNKQVLDALIKAGAFDRLGGNRAQMIAGLERVMQFGAQLQSDQQNGQMNLFRGSAEQTDYSQDSKKLPNVAPWPETMMLNYEKQVLGFYVTSNPLSHHAETINTYSNINTSELEGCGEGKQIIIGGLITKLRSHIVKRGKNAGSKMAVFVLEDLQGTSEAVLFPSVYEKHSELLVEDKVIFVKGKVDHKREKPNIFVDELITLERANEKLAGRVVIRLNSREVTKQKVAAIKDICLRHKGKTSIHVAIKTDKASVYAAADRALAVTPDLEFCKKMKQLVGGENLPQAK